MAVGHILDARGIGGMNKRTKAIARELSSLHGKRHLNGLKPGSNIIHRELRLEHAHLDLYFDDWASQGRLFFRELM